MGFDQIYQAAECWARWIHSFFLYHFRIRFPYLVQTHSLIYFYFLSLSLPSLNMYPVNIL